MKKTMKKISTAKEGFWYGELDWVAPSATKEIDGFIWKSKQENMGK